MLKYLKCGNWIYWVLLINPGLQLLLVHLCFQIWGEMHFLFKEEHIMTLMMNWKTEKMCFCQETVILLLKQNMVWKIKWFFAIHKTSAKFKSFKLNTYRYFHICKYSCFCQIYIFSWENKLFTLLLPSWGYVCILVSCDTYILSRCIQNELLGVFLSFPGSMVLVTQLTSTTLNVGCSTWMGWMQTLPVATGDKNTDCFLSTCLAFVLQVVLHEALEKWHQTKLKQVMASFKPCWVYSAIPALLGAV